MEILERLEPRGVFRIFEELCAIPHGSGNTKGVSDWLMAFARERKLEAYQDQLNNVIIIKEATPGYENAEPVLLQGHMDMVCEKAPGCAKDMDKEGLDLPVEEYDTFAGYVFGLYGSVPQDGRTISVRTDQLQIHVERIKDHKLEEATVRRISQIESASP